jgi:hypothetical protein
MASGVGERSLLAPAGETAVDKFWITSHELVGSDAEPFADAGAKRFTKDIGLLGESLEKLNAFGRFEIDSDRSAASIEFAVALSWFVARRNFVQWMDTDDVCAHVGEFEGAVRQCPKAREFDDCDAFEWSHDSPFATQGDPIGWVKWPVRRVPRLSTENCGEGACVGAIRRRTSAPMELTERDRAILDFERSWWHETGPKETLIQERFELSASRYYEILGQLLESPEAYDYDPLGVRRLRRLRDRRRRARQETAHQQASEPPGS